MKTDQFRDHLWVAILAGGGGTRLWPLSREKNPKQFIKLFGKKTLIQVNAQRISEIVPWERIFAVTTNQLYAKEIAREVPRLPKDHILVEPARRGTAVAHGLAAVYIQNLDPEAVILNQYADSIVTPISRYLNTYLVAAEAAYKTGSLVAIGVKPEYPHPGMGHIKLEGIAHRFNGRVVFKVGQFIEKPALALARRYTKSGNYVWNAGMYVWRADSILKSLSIHAPKISQALNRIHRSLGKSNLESVIRTAYHSISEISIDYAVSEKESNFLAVKADFNWVDVGDWSVVWQLTHKDKDGNAVIHLDRKGDWLGIETSNTLVQTEKLLIATIGVTDLVIIETHDALLVANKNKSQLVKNLVNTLKEEKKEKFL